MGVKPGYRLTCGKTRLRPLTHYFENILLVLDQHFLVIHLGRGDQLAVVLHRVNLELGHTSPLVVHFLVWHFCSVVVVTYFLHCSCLHILHDCDAISGQALLIHRNIPDSMWCEHAFSHRLVISSQPHSLLIIAPFILPAFATIQHVIL